MSALQFKKDLVEIGRRMYQRGFVAANDGNMSIRVSESEILITPTGVSKGYMNPDDMVTVDPEGNTVQGNTRPSSELNMHLAIYKNRADVRSVCHAHPAYATAFAACGKELDQCVLSEMVYSLGRVPLVAYGMPGTEDLYADIFRFLQDYDAFLLANHGVVTVGKDLLNAYHKMETVEHTAKITFLSDQMGGAKKLSAQHVQYMISKKEAQGIHTKTDCTTCKDDSDCAISITDSQTNLIDEIVNKVLREVAKRK